MTTTERYATPAWGATERGGLDVERLLTRPEWQQQAACRGKATAAWFPEPGEDPEPARAICRTCPVSAECRDYALTLETCTPGVWGGTTGLDRPNWPSDRELPGHQRTAS